MDVLTDVLNALELQEWISARRELTPPWHYNFAASHDMIFHLLSSSGGYLSVEGDPTPLRIEGGGVLLFPFGHAHSICDELTSPLTQVLHVDYSAQREYQDFPAASDASKMAVLCGAFHVEHPGAFPLLHSLPKVIHIPAEQGHTVEGFTEIVQLIAREAATPRLGAEVMLRRLTELLFIHVIRAWVEQQAASSRGWIAALRDQPISTALGLIHQSPERGWKVEELAEAVALSRAVFSARFTRLVGEPPIKYLTRWRMYRATRLLKDNVEMEKIAELLGYESAVAFHKAFKREIGMPPARYRKLG
ncbi:AraC family transcriptional regulator [Ktedonobacter racemifer]|uniref:Transcriptional regulator, AraC family n=1 Tax=Ktedonobacter racemifer DSM 44963 TaxID=485913 RepID=D6TTX5_KTERA|nr:AraC family transcriptional regulator [Ktedonobacter racemifer]EFH83876.1 transcriptional regulator, AraC family [Ktedonobacter racemifer DSM 44963]